MTQAERIREYYREHPAASYDEVAEVVGTTKSNVSANLAKDSRQADAFAWKISHMTTRLTITIHRHSLSWLTGRMILDVSGWIC